MSQSGSRLIYFCGLVFALCGLLSCAAKPVEQTTARDLFYHDLHSNQQGAAQTNSVAPSAAYRLELTRGDTAPVIVDNKFTFSSGDKVKLYLRVSSPAYCYVLSSGSSGKKTSLYPPPGEDNHLDAGREYAIPANGVLEFDDNPGAEHLVVVLSHNALDESQAMQSVGVSMEPALLNGQHQKTGDYAVFNTSSNGLVYVSNSDASKPTAIEIALNHKKDGDAIGETTGGGVKILYQVESLKSDLVNAHGIVEAAVALSPSNINMGDRDQYLAGLNHLYPNYFLQSQGQFYTQEQALLHGLKDCGQTVHKDNWTGDIVCVGSPGDVCLPQIVARIAYNLLRQKPTLVVGQPASHAVESSVASTVNTGRELDQLWDQREHEPLIVLVFNKSKLMGKMPGSHVFAVTARRPMPNGNNGKTSNSEYFAFDSRGKTCQGWVSADALVSAMNYTDDEHDESAPPSPREESDSLQSPGGDTKYLLAEDGIKPDLPDVAPDAFAAFKSAVRSGTRASDQDPVESEQGSYKNSAEQEADMLRKHIADDASGLSKDDKALVEKSISEIMNGKTDEGGSRLFPLTPLQQAAVLHECNRMFDEEKRIYDQGLEQVHRNRALVAMVHDIANPLHLNQGAGATCNVTSTTKIECLRYPATQAKRFVDMYTNFNGDQTVNMP